MIQELLPEAYLKPLYGQPADLSGGPGPGCDIVREKAQSLPLAYQLADQIGASDLQTGADLQGHAGQALFHKPPVAHPPLGQKKGLLRQLLGRDALPVQSGLFLPAIK